MAIDSRTPTPEADDLAALSRGARPARALGGRLAELSLLSAVGRAVNASLQLRSALEDALQALLEARRYRAASILLLDWETQEIEVYTERRSGDGIEFAFRRFDLLALAPATAAALPLHPVLTAPSPAAGGPLLAVPLAAEGRVLGLLTATLPNRRRPLQAERRLLTTVSSQIARAVENGRLYERTRREADRLAAVNAVGSAIRKSLRVPSLLEQALDQLLAVTNLEFGVVFLHTEAPAGLSIAVRSGVSKGLASGLARQSLERLVDRPARGTGSLGPVVTEDLPVAAHAKQAPRCLMHIPLHSPERLLGVITVGSYSQRHFAPGALELLAGIASQISLALENALLYERSRQSASRLEAINTMATAANQTPEIDTFLRTALGTVVEAASLRGAGVLLLNREESSLSQLSYQGDTACPVARLGRQPIPFEADTVLEGHLEGHLRPYLDAEQGVGATAWLPLQTKGRFLGVLVAGAGGKALAPAMMDLLEALAGQVAIGLDNALLYREAERRAAQLAETNQALREALRGKDEFLANVTHELRRPLAPARLVVETLLEAPPGKLSRQRQDRLLRNALNNLDSLNTLVSELLDTVRLERRTQPFADDVFDLCTTTRRSLATMRPLAEARHIQIQAILPPVAVRVRGDPQALARVIANLLSNAIKFNKEGGSILLQLERTSEGRALLSVTDTGIGIPSHARPHIFERFYQADSSSTRTHEGLGLGLYIAKETVERHAGQIRFDTEEGVGSTFTVTLPLA